VRLAISPASDKSIECLWSLSGRNCNGFDWTDRYPSITKAAARLGCRSAIIEGEVIVQDERGVSEFKALKSAIRCTPQRLVFCFVHCFAQ
jgi:hypothetical protein